MLIWTKILLKVANSPLQVKEQLKVFQNMNPADPRFESTIKALMKDLSEHIKEKESKDLPKLEQALATEEIEHLAKSFGRTKMFVPSRSHFTAPDKPPFETAIGLVTAPIDHPIDLFRKWPHTSGMPILRRNRLLIVLKIAYSVVYLLNVHADLSIRTLRENRKYFVRYSLLLLIWDFLSPIVSPLSGNLFLHY